MAGETGKVGTGYEAPSPAVQAALDMPLEQLEAQIKQTEQGTVPATTNPESTQTATVTPKTPADNGQVTKVKEETTQQEGQPVPVVEPGKTAENAVTYDTIKAKYGFKSPDSLAKSFDSSVKELQRMKREEAEKLKSQQLIQPAQPVIPQANPENSGFLNQLLENPEMTLAQAFMKMNEVANAQLREKNSDIERKLKFQEMAGSPDTADFVSDEIQAQMQEEYKSRPEWLSSQSDINTHLDEAYWIAKGKVAAKSELKALEEGKKLGQQSILQKKAGSVESAGSMAAPQGVSDTNPMTMPITDLEDLIQKQLKG